MTNAFFYLQMLKRIKGSFLNHTQLLTLTSLFISNSVFGYYPTQFDSPLETIAFGSCNFQRNEQSHWRIIQGKKPDLWIWGGDNIYADKLPLSLKRGEYNVLRSNPHYKAFREAIPIIGTWDDHDYSSNSSGGGANNKPEHQKLALDFLDEPTTSSRRTQEGIYTSYVYGSGKDTVRIILLDVRYFREPPEGNVPLTEALLLGADQWKWLEAVFQENTAPLMILVSGSQIFPFESDGDSWQRQYPFAFKKLTKLIASTSSKVLLLSGDRHYAEISEAQIQSRYKNISVVEFTSSGLTHSSEGGVTKNSYRVSKWMNQKNFGLIRIQWNTLPRVITLEMNKTDGTVLDQYQIEF